MKKILIDNGHGMETAGKRSPDKAYHEWAWTREIARMLVDELVGMGYDAQLLVPESNDVSLQERVRRVNEMCRRLGSDNVLLVSIHSNAAGNGGQWTAARGWSAYTSRGNTEADALARHLYREAEKNFAGHKIRTDYSDRDPDLEENFYILAKTKCPAVLTENFFHNNKEDMAYIMSPEGKQAIVKTHRDGIVNYIREREERR